MMLRKKQGISRKTGIPMVLTSVLLLTQLASVGTVARGEAPEELLVYGDSLSAEFVNYSWAQSDMAETGTVHGGSRSIMMDPDENQALYFYKDRIMVADNYSSLRFWVHGGDTGGQQLKLVLSLGGQSVAEVPVESLVDGGITKGQWKLAEVKLADLGISGLLDGIWLWGSGSQEPVYLDDMTFVPKGVVGGGASSPSPTPTPSASTTPGTPSPTPSVTPSATPSATPSGEPSGSPTPSPTPGGGGPIEPVEGVYVYDDALAGSWADYGWAAHSLEEPGVVHTGSRSIRFTPRGDDAIYLYSDRILLTKEYEKLQLWVNGGESGGQGVKLVWMSGGQAVTERTFTELLGGTGIPAGQWAKVEVPLADLNLPNELFDGLLIAGTGGEVEDVFFDDIALISKKVEQAAVLEVRMDVPTAVLLEGDELQLQVESYLEGGETSFVTEQAEWAADREDVVRVENGRVTAVGLGIAKVTAAYQGKTAEAYVQVTEAAAEPVYEEGLAEGIRNLSWHDKDMANREEAHSGELSVKFEPDGWDGVWLAGAEKDVTDYYGFRFWIHGGTAGGQNLLFHAYDGYTNLGAVALDKVLPEGRLPADVWTEVTVRFADLGLTSGQFDGFVFQAGTENDQVALYIDDVQLLRNLNPGQLPEPEVPVVNVRVDTASGRKAINPDIYGINYDDMGPTKSTLPFAVQRWGGNQTTRYNWELDVANRASDWYFMNYPYDNEHPEQLPEGSESDRFIDGTLASGGKVLLTVPTIGWTPKDRSITYGFSQEKYGAQQDSSYELRDAGNGVFRDGSLVTGNDPLDTSKRIGPDFVTRWMDHIKERTGDQVNYYALDNEPEIWHVTHRDVHPNPPTYDEIWGFTKTYATAIKEKDPDAKVFGPVSWGWCAYFYSSADNCAEGPDRAAHGGTPFLEWYLQKVKQEEDSTGVRLVDYLDIHYYPQENGIPTFEEGPAVAKRRLQSLKSLYDPNYVDQSWIQEPIRLIPRMKEIIDRNLPGAKLAITEYNFGNGDGISAGLAQAEALAIFGREGVDLATRFGNLPAGTALEDAFKLYLNYDGKGSKIEGVSVRTVSSLHDAVGAYTIEGTDGKLYVLLFNKDTVTREVGVATDRTAAGSAELYRFDAATRLSAAGTVGVGADGALSLQLPARSATLVVVPAGAAQ